MTMYKYFTISEFDCTETGENKMKEEFIHKLDELRERCGFAFHINSGYRSPEHSIEKKKVRAGTHTQGIAVDIACNNGVQRRRIVEEALKMGFKGIGIARGFVHVDDRRSTPVIWCY